MSDLFPKTTNYYFVEDSGWTESELKKDVLKTVIPTMIVFGLYFFFSTLLKNENVNMVTLLFTTIIGSIIGGGIIGYMLWAFFKLMKMFWEAGKALPLLFNSLGSRPAFEHLMKRNSPEFSWEYFSDKVVSLLKMILYAEDATQLPNYVGDPIDNLFENVVDSYYTGAMGLKNYKVEGDWCYVTVGVYMDNLYDIGGRIWQKRDKFRVYLCRNIRTPMDARFSIKCIRCKNCGSSFDATKRRNCPACETRYEIGEDDWIVLRIKKA